MNECGGPWPILLLPNLHGEPQGQFLKSQHPFNSPRGSVLPSRNPDSQTSLAGSWAAGRISRAFSGASFLHSQCLHTPLGRSEVGQSGGAKPGALCELSHCRLVPLHKQAN